MKKNWNSPGINELDMRATAAGHNSDELDYLTCGSVSGIGDLTECPCDCS